MEDNKYQLKIKLDLSGESAKYYKLQERWENEGGSTSDQPITKLLSETEPPLQTGDYFQVIGGKIDFIGNEIFYIADIQKVDIQ
ncbi:MAG TPA: hypothetical protein VFM80_03910 [Gracilimonas sp.]|uniref:hypothetical protein n=1 Tax=Gracilimonas sp. TaxID=1974203 RepID=UPI002D881F73|nr:hypothetical protein [Gracilimonas sp.]